MTIHVHDHCLKMARREDGTPWWTEFPEPKSTPNTIDRAVVLSLLEQQDGPRDFLLVDARRTDCTGGTVSSSINLPAHSFYPTRKTLYDLCTRAGIKKVIFYCGMLVDSRYSPLTPQANPTGGAHDVLPGCRTISTKSGVISSRKS